MSKPLSLVTNHALAPNASDRKCLLRAFAVAQGRARLHEQADLGVTGEVDKGRRSPELDAVDKLGSVELEEAHRHLAGDELDPDSRQSVRSSSSDAMPLF